MPCLLLRSRLTDKPMRCRKGPASSQGRTRRPLAVPPPLPPPPHSRPRADRVPRSQRGAASAPTHQPFQNLQNLFKPENFKTPDPAPSAQRRFSADGSVTGVAFLIAGYPWGDSDISWRFVDEVPITRPKITKKKKAKIKNKTAKSMGRTEWP